MALSVECCAAGHRLRGEGSDLELVNRFLAHLGTRSFSAATVRAYAYDLLNFLRFLADHRAAGQLAGCGGTAALRAPCGPSWHARPS